MLYAFFWVIPWHLNFMCRRFRTLRLFHLHRQVGACLWRWNRKSVAKCRHIKFRHRGITQKKAYNIQDMAKVWNQENIDICVFLDRYKIILHFLVKTLWSLYGFKDLFLCKLSNVGQCFKKHFTVLFVRNWPIHYS